MILTNLVQSLIPKSLETLNAFDREIGISKHIPWSYFVDPEIFVTKKGELGSVIHLEGIPFEVKDIDELNHLQASLSFALQNLGDEYSVYITTYRHKKSCDLGGDYPEGFSKEFSTAYNSQFQDAQLFVNDIYLTILMKGSDHAAQIGLDILKSLSTRKELKKNNEIHNVQLRKFRQTLVHFKASLKSYNPKVLGECTTQSDKDLFNIEVLPKAEALSFLSILVNGCERELTYPYQDIASFIPEKRIFFGHDTIHFQGLTKGEDVFGAMLSIKAYTPHTFPGMLNKLLSMPFEYITTHSFIGIEKNDALSMIDTQAKRLYSTDDAAISQINELEDAKDDLASGKINYGFHHNTIFVLSNKLESLEEQLARIIKVYQDQRIAVVRETLNLESAFWSQIPGNAKYIRRLSPISSNNFSSFCSLHNYYTGYINKNHLGSALMLVETASKTPFYFNLHEEGSGRYDDLTKGHTTIIGPSNAGKTVIITTIDAMMQKYGVHSFFFDRNCGCELYVRAMGGVYSKLVPGRPTGWNPFQLPETEINKHFLRDFLKVLSTCDTEALTAQDINQITEVVERNYTLPHNIRNLSTISHFFTSDFKGLSALSRYLRLPDKTGRVGDRAYLFDNDTDVLSFDTRTMGFDMTYLLNDTGERVEELLPVSMYLFHRLEAELNANHLTGLYLDEGWQFLNNPYWIGKIGESLVTWRKRNAYVVFATQLPDKIAQSPLASSLIQGSATNIFLANSKAQEKDYIDGFKLTHRELEIIKNTQLQSRYFLYKQNNEAAIVRINLSGVEKYISILSSTSQSVSLCDDIRAEVGDESAKWLSIFYDKQKEGNRA